ncbi:MAG TPA: alpha/beta hydrolase [Terracidiphilus sp.]|nr:alpha/beta hydrolase [Terracidiphilus sp.]
MLSFRTGVVVAVAAGASLLPVRCWGGTRTDPQAAAGYTEQFVTVEPGVKLQVLDWGGSGRPLVLLAGEGSTAHEFDGFAPKLTANYHVYGITRRGFGKSSKPLPTADNYSAARLGKDVLAVIEQLKLERPVLVGHSIAGEELSYIGTTSPSSVAGLVYLDAAQGYAFYDPAVSNPEIDYYVLRRDLERLAAIRSMSMDDRKSLLNDLAEMLPRFEKDLDSIRQLVDATPANAPGLPDTPEARVEMAIQLGEQRFGGVKCPALAISAVPHSFGNRFKNNPAALKSAQSRDEARTSALADAFQKANPQATVLRIKDASHAIFISNEAEVLRAINAFVATLH